MPDSGQIIPERGYGFATGSFRGGVQNVTNSAGVHSKDQPVNQIVASVAMIGGIVTGSANSNTGMGGVVTGAYYNIATAIGSNTPVSGGTKLTDARTFLSASFRGHSSSLIQSMNYLEARITDAGSVELSDIDIDGGTDIGEAIVDADLFIVDNGADGTNRKSTAARIKTYVGSGFTTGDATQISTTDISASKAQFGDGGFAVAGPVGISGTLTVDNAATTLVSLSLSDGDITNVGTISTDKIQVDAAAAGLEIDFNGNNTLNKIQITDNLADALNIAEGSNSYLKFVTTNSSEEITLGVDLNAGANVVAGTGFDINGGTINGVAIAESNITAGNAKMILTTGTGASYFSGKVARFGMTGSSNLEIAGYAADGTSGYFRLAVSGGMLQVQEL